MYAGFEGIVPKKRLHGSQCRSFLGLHNLCYSLLTSTGPFLHPSVFGQSTRILLVICQKPLGRLLEITVPIDMSQKYAHNKFRYSGGYLCGAERSAVPQTQQLSCT